MREALPLVLDQRTTFTRVKDYFKQWTRYGREVQNRTKYEIAKQAFEEVVPTTPVKFGWARASWAVGRSPVTQKDLPRPPKGTIYPPAKFNVSYSENDDTDFEIVNDAPHIWRLNGGWSTQAPAGFIEAATDRGIRRANEIMRRRV